jgi:DNA-binding CsgD family transcriptional regulator
VLELADSGLSNKSIALSLGISRSTVSSFLERARKKTQGADSPGAASVRETRVRSRDHTGDSTAPKTAVLALSPAERDLVELALAGHSNAAIARKRRCSVHTVANQMSSAYRKLGIASRRELHASSMRVQRG